MNCEHRTIVCLSCGATIVSCTCEGETPLLMYSRCGETPECEHPEGASQEPIPAPAVTEKPTRESVQTAQMPPIANVAAMTFQIEDPEKFASWLRAMADMVERAPRVRFGASPAKPDPDPEAE